VQADALVAPLVIEAVPAGQSVQLADPAVA
jgi:hypothetical protein